MIDVLVVFSMVFGVIALLILRDIASALERRAKAEEKIATSIASFSEKTSLELELFRQYYAHAVEKQWDAVR